MAIPNISRSSKESERLFNANAGEYTEIVDNAVEFIGLPVEFFSRKKAIVLSEMISTRFGDGARLRLNDVGCGVGLLHGHLAREQFEVTGVDVAGNALQYAAKKNPHATYLHYDGHRLPFVDESFDVALSVCVLHHIPCDQRNAFLSELKRVVRKGGAVCIIEHNPFNPFTRIAVNRCRFDQGVILASGKEIRRRLVEVGCAGLSTRYFTFFPTIGRISNCLERYLASWPIGAQHCTLGVV